MPRPYTMLTASLLVIAACCGLAACSKSEQAPAAATPAAQIPPAAAQEVAHAFSIGELSALALSDGRLEFPNDNQIFGLGHTTEEVNALLTGAGLPTDKLHLGLAPLLVKTADRVLLFDTGAGTNFGPTAGKLADSLAQAGIDAHSVTDIFISHIHGDHVGGLVDAQGAPNFANAAIHISKPEWTFLTSMSAASARNFGVSNHDALVAAMTPRVDAFAPGAELIPGVVTAVDIKGHTPGHSGYRIDSGADSLLYVGDSMHHYVISVQKADWPMAFDSDQAAGATSRAALIAQSAASGQRVYAVHFPFPGLGKFAKRGDGFVWVAEMPLPR